MVCLDSFERTSFLLNMLERRPFYWSKVNLGLSQSKQSQLRAPPTVTEYKDNIFCRQFVVLAKIRPTRIQCRNCVCYRSVFLNSFCCIHLWGFTSWLPYSTKLQHDDTTWQLWCVDLRIQVWLESWPESRTFKFRCQLNVAPLGKRKGVSKELFLNGIVLMSFDPSQVQTLRLLFSFIIVTCHKKTHINVTCH